MNIGISLCKIVERCHAQGYLWASLKLSDLILCRNKGNNISIYLRSRDIAWKVPSKTLLDTCLVPWELFWEEPLGNGFEVSEVYIIATLLYFLASKATNLLSYNSLSSPYGLPTLKLFRTPEKYPLTIPSAVYFESLINQAMLLHPVDRVYKTVAPFRESLERLLSTTAEMHGRYFFDVGDALDVGDAKRENDWHTNEDRLFVTSYNLEKHGWGIFVLCDGVSTANLGNGGRASEIVVHKVQDWWQSQNEAKRLEVCQSAQTDFASACSFLNDLVSEANRQIRMEVEGLATEVGADTLVMGSTVVVGLIYNRVMVFGWLGDSGMYRISSWGWERLNYGDNERNGWLKEGKPFDEFKEAGNALTQCVGAHFYKKERIEMHFGITLLYPGELILISSDGIPDYIEPEASYVYQENYQMLRIASVLTEYQQDILLDSKALASVLISTVNRVGGGYDNLAAILIRLLPEGYTEREKSFQRLQALFMNMPKALQQECYLKTQKVAAVKLQEPK
jgi:serine/threonine protein phosphatase PrpC